MYWTKEKHHSTPTFFEVMEYQYNKFKTETIIEFYPELTGEWEVDKMIFIRNYDKLLNNYGKEES